MGKFVDLTGQKFGRLTVLGLGERGKCGHIRWRCVCECGKVTLVDTGKLKSGHTQSCGCKNIENYKEKHETAYPKRLSRVYYGMKERCCYENNISYKYYGGNGVKICDEWLKPKTGRLAFCKWAIENGYDANAPRGQCTIDRIDLNKGYSPDNCRVVNQCIQNINKQFDGGKTGVCGVDYRFNRYIARISYNRKRINLGCFETLEEATAARQAAELKYYGRVLTN